MDSKRFKSEKNLFQRPVKNNGFVNFMRQFVKHSQPPPDLAGVRLVWNLMTEQEKEHFRDPTELFLVQSYMPPKECHAPKKKPRCPRKKHAVKKRCSAKPKRTKCPRTRKRKPKCCSKRRPKARPRAKCAVESNLPNNGYLNFLRAYRRKHFDMKPNDLVMKAARAWCRMPQLKKDAYRRQVRTVK